MLCELLGEKRQQLSYPAADIVRYNNALLCRAWKMQARTEIDVLALPDDFSDCQRVLCWLPMEKPITDLTPW